MCRKSEAEAAQQTGRLTLRGLSMKETVETSAGAADGFGCSSRLLQETRGCECGSQGRLQPTDTHFWFCSISSSADKADVPLFPCGGATGSLGYEDRGLLTCRLFMGVPFCYTTDTQTAQRVSVMDSDTCGRVLFCS